MGQVVPVLAWTKPRVTPLDGGLTQEEAQRVHHLARACRHLEAEIAHRTGLSAAAVQDVLAGRIWPGVARHWTGTRAATQTDGGQECAAAS